MPKFKIPKLLCIIFFQNEIFKKEIGTSLALKLKKKSKRNLP